MSAPTKPTETEKPAPLSEQLLALKAVAELLRIVLAGLVSVLDALIDSAERRAPLTPRELQRLLHWPALVRLIELLCELGAVPTAPASPSHLGEILRRLREAAGLTRAELADATNCSPATIRNIETWRHLPTRATLAKLTKHPAMSPLLAMAQRAGLVLDLDDTRDGGDG